RLIAERAGVNEVTLFRHFGNKRGIVEAAIERFSFMDELEEVLQHSIEWDIEKDLRLIAKIYHERLGSKREIVLVSFREAYQFPELDAQISRLPKRFQAFLTEYFTEMIKREK